MQLSDIAHLERGQAGRLAPLPTIQKVPRSKRKKGWAGWIVRSAIGDRTFKTEWEARKFWVERVLREVTSEGKDKPIDYCLVSLLRKLEPSWKEGTVDHYGWIYRNVLAHFSGRTIRSITVDDLVAFREKAAMHTSPYLVSSAMYLLRETFLHARALGFVTLDPFDELPEAPPEQRARVTKALAERSVTTPPAWVILMMLNLPGPLGDFLNASILLGGRARETIALDRSDFDPEDETLHFWRQLKINGERALKTPGSERYVEVCEELAVRLGMRAQDYATSDLPLLCDAEGKRWTYHGVRQAFYDWQVSVGLAHLDEAGVVRDHVTMHQLRHAFVAVLLAHGVDIVTIADWLGHITVATTLNIYAGLLDGQEGANPKDVLAAYALGQPAVPDAASPAPTPQRAGPQSKVSSALEEAA